MKEETIVASNWTTVIYTRLNRWIIHQGYEAWAQKVSHAWIWEICPWLQQGLSLDNSDTSFSDYLALSIGIAPYMLYAHARPPVKLAWSFLFY